MSKAASEGRRIRAARMTSLLLDDRPTDDRTVAGVVEWFGAMQGQDFASVTWSLGLRTGRTRDEVGAAFESGQILRTWPMRGTLHVLPGADARWMIHAPRRPRSSRGRGSAAVPRVWPRRTPTGPPTSSARPWPAAGR